jgi:CheY-like chemotaxis protein
MSDTQTWTLFVDDAPSLLQRIKGRLADIGYRSVEVTSTAEEAFRLLTSRRIGHVISDWRMPNPGGISFLRTVREQYPELRCTLLTGFSNDLRLDEREEEPDMDSAHSGNISGPADIIAEQRLRIEELERVVRIIAADLIDELEAVRSIDAPISIIGSKSKMSIPSLVQEIKSLTPLGRRLIELDRAARRRLIDLGRR